MTALLRLLVSLTAALALIAPAHAHDDHAEPGWSLVIHGGAGVISRDRLSEEQDAEIRAVLQRALDTGSAILAAGGTAMDAVEATIMVMEDDPNFNAGRGAVFTWEGTNSLDTSFMDGRTRDAGAAAGVSSTRNPIQLARAVMEHSPHVLLSGEGADQFSREQGLAQADAAYFATPERRAQWERFRARAAEGVTMGPLDIDYKFGTVGAVALDQNGDVAAGTSTGGMTGKRWGRIGDSPIIGAGTIADNRSCAVSATGSGEYFIRAGVAQELCTQLRMLADMRINAAIEAAMVSGSAADEDRRDTLVHMPLSADEVQEVADNVIGDMASLRRGEDSGSGGIIYLTPWGHTGYSFDTEGMYRGTATSSGTNSVAIYGDEE